MAKKDFTDFKIWCSEIHSLFSIPKGVKPLKKDLIKYEKLLNSESEKSEDELKFIKEVSDKIDIFNDCPLSQTTISALIRQYGKKVYNKKIAAKGDAMSFLKKGTDMEGEAVDLLSKIDKKDYQLVTDNIENEYLIGRCDIIQPEKIIDTKISWNINAFLKSRTSKLTAKYWYQMQGYMELYNVGEAEVVFLLLNTPPELIEREKIKLLNKFMIGEIDRDKYELDVDNIESAFTYSSIPLNRRVFRYRLKREPQIFDTVYRKVEKAREWMQQFDKDMKTNIFVVPSGIYLDTEKNNIEPDSNESLENDTGG